MATRAGAIGNLPWVRGTSQPGVKMAPRGAQHKEAITAELIAEATKIGGKQFIQKYGLASWRNIATATTGGTIGYRVSESIDDTTHKSVPIETGEGTYIGDTGEKERERERIAAEERERMKGAPAPKVETGWKESFPDQSGELIDSSPPPSTPEPIEIPQESFPDQSEEFNKPQIFYSKKDDISKQTEELVPEKPEFGKLTETEKQTAKALKGDKPDYYSRVARAVEGSQDVATADQWMGIIQGQGATEAELYYLGLTELLKGKEKITKENLLNHIKEKDISSRITTTQIPDKDREVIDYEHFRLKGTDSDSFETYVMQFDVTKDKEGNYLPHDEPIIYRADATHIGKEEYGRNTFLTLRTQVGYQPSFRHEGTEKTTEHNKWAMEIGKIFENTLIGDEIQLDLIQRGRLTGFEKDFDVVKGSDLISYLDKNKIKYDIEKEDDPYEADIVGEKYNQSIKIYHGKDIDKKFEVLGSTEKVFTPNSMYIFGHPVKLKAVGEGESAGFMRYDDRRIDRTKPKELQKRITPNAWTGKLSDHISLLPDFPITSDTKGAELGIMELIRIAIENGNDSIAIPNGQILADRYQDRENLKVWQDKIQLGVLKKIAKRNNTTVTEHVIRKKKEFTKESGLHIEGTVDWMNEAKEQGYSLKKVSKSWLKNLLLDPDDPEGRVGEVTLAHQDIPDFISMMTENAYSRNHISIGNELSIESSHDKSYYIWQEDSSGDIKFELPIVGANEAEEYMANEDRDLDTSAYVEGLSEDFAERTYLEYLFNKIEEYQGKAKGTREDHKLYKMKIPKSLQRKILSESQEFTELPKQKLPIKNQTERLFA